MKFVGEDGLPFKAGEGPFEWKSIPEGTSTQLVAAFDPSIAGQPASGPTVRPSLTLSLDPGQSRSYLQDAQIANGETEPYALNKVRLTSSLFEPVTSLLLAYTGQRAEAVGAQQRDGGRVVRLMIQRKNKDGRYS